MSLTLNPITGKFDVVTKGAVLTSRTISTSAPLTGGGNLSADRTLSVINDAAGAITEFDTGALADLDTVIPTSKAVKTYADGKITDTTDIIKDTHIDWGTGANQVSGADVPLDTTNFNNNLSGTDTNVQTAMETLDELTASGGDWVAATGTWSHSEGTQGTTFSRAYTNDPAAGSNISLSMSDTSGFNVDDYVVVSSSAGQEQAKITVVTASTSITVDSLALNHTTSSPLVYRQINYSFIVSINADVTGELQAGYKIKLTQDASTKYFIVTNVGSYGGGVTLVTLFSGTDYALTTSTISSVYYSQLQNPAGFDTDPAKWKVEIINANFQYKTTPTQETWYNFDFIVMPVGSWKFNWVGFFFATDNPGTYIGVFGTISTACNSESNVNMTGGANFKFPSGDVYAYSNAYRSGNYNITTPTTLFMNIKTSEAGQSAVGHQGARSPLILTANCGYL